MTTEQASWNLGPVALPLVPKLTVNEPIVSVSEQPPLAEAPVLDPALCAKTRVWGVDFARLTMDQTLQLAEHIIRAGRPEYFITANLNYLMLTANHPRLAEVNRRCCCILADGQPIVARSRWSAQPLPARVAGSDLIVELARLSADKGFRIFLLGGAPGVAAKAAEALQRRYPGVQIAGTYAPPFRELTPAEQVQLIERIRQARPDILLVAFGQPKGEIWIHDHLEQLAVPLSIQLGASFDFLAGRARRAPRLWQVLGCEWLYRALSDPRRLLPRYLGNARFLIQLLARDLRQWLARPAASSTQSLSRTTRSGESAGIAATIQTRER